MARESVGNATCPRCGGRLARDNTSGRCTPCQATERDRIVSPPALPAEFWNHEPIRRACAERHIGKVFRAYRCHPYHGRHPLPQETVGRWLGITQAQMSRIENGRPIIHLDRLTHWAQVLRIPADLLWFKLRDDKMYGQEANVYVSGSTTSTGTSSARDRAGSRTSGRWRRDPVSPDDDLHFIRSLRSADRRVGGGHLYATVAACLGSGADIASASEIPEPLLVATASLNEIAGWMAHDAGDVSSARRHLSGALALAKRSEDDCLVGQVCASLSHLACYQGDASEALSRAQEGLDSVRDASADSPLVARLLAMRARGLAIAGRAPEAVDVLVRAEVALRRASAPVSEWLSPFDEASFAIEAGRCFLRVGDLSEARRRLQDVLDKHHPERVRSRAFAQLMLVTALLGRGQIDEACMVTYQAVEQTSGLGSAVIVDQLRHVGLLFTSYARTVPDVPALLDRLRQAIRERAWIGALNVGPNNADGSRAS